MGKRSIRRLLSVLACLLALPLPAFACASAAQTAGHDGIYVSAAFTKAVKLKRNVYAAADENPMVIFIKKGKVQLSNIHETWDIGGNDCIASVEKGALQFRPAKNTTALTYNKIEAASPQAYYFDMLFKGCYKDQKSNKFCFGDNAITDKKVLYPAELELDSSELDIRGNNLKIEGDKLHWVLMPTARGWNVYRSDWASAEGYKPFDESKPWKILTRIGD